MKATHDKTNEDDMQLLEPSHAEATKAAEKGERIIFTQLLLKMSLEEREDVMTLLLTTANLDLEFILWVNELDINTLTHKTDNILNGIIFAQRVVTEAISADTLPHNPSGVAQVPLPADSTHLNSSSSLSTGTSSTTQPAVVRTGQATVQVSQVQSTAAVTESREQGL
jgi:hypothetical protein